MICGEGEQAAAVEKGTKKREAQPSRAGKTLRAARCAASLLNKRP